MGLLHSHHNDSSNTEKTKLQSKNTWNRVTLNTRLKSCFLCILMEAMGKKHQFDSEPSNCPSIGLQETTSTAHWWCHLQRKHTVIYMETSHKHFHSLCIQMKCVDRFFMATDPPLKNYVLAFIHSYLFYSPQIYRLYTEDGRQTMISMVYR